MDAKESIEAFTITFRREIIFYLRQLIGDKELVTVSCDDGEDAFLTLLLDIDEKNDSLIFDWSDIGNTAQHLLNSRQVQFVANPVGVRNQFLTGKPRKTTYKGLNAFATSIPEKFIRFQRREYFRLVLSMSQRIPCQLTHGAISVPMSVVDIGIGGVGLESATADIAFEPGCIFKNVAIDLGKIGRLNVDLELQHLRELSHGAKQFKKLGCKFVRLGSLNESLLQKFITRIQQDERNRLG